MDTYAPRITKYYQQPGSQLGRKVTQVLFEVRSKKPPKPLSGGETWTGKHALFDGGYWKQMGPDERVAFIEGYLACYRENFQATSRKFSRSSDYYADKISRWFGVRGSEMNWKLADVAIADALYRYADRAPASK